MLYFPRGLSNPEPEPTDVTITVTVEGANQDRISIYTEDGELVQELEFGAGATDIALLDVPEDGSDRIFRFVSHVAKNTDGSDFEKIFSINADTTDTIRVMPDGLVLYWFGNECLDVTGGWTPPSKIFNTNIGFSNLDLNYSGGTVTRTKRINTLKTYVSMGAGGKGNASFYPQNNIDVSRFTRMRSIVLNSSHSIGSSGSGWSMIMFMARVPDNVAYVGYSFGSIDTNRTESIGTLEGDIPDAAKTTTGNVYISLISHAYESFACTATVEWGALWLE